MLAVCPWINNLTPLKIQFPLLWVRIWVKPFAGIEKIPQQLHEAGVIIPILQVGKLRLREGNYIVQITQGVRGVNLIVH